MASTNDIAVIPYSPLAQGLLTNKYLGGIPEGSRASKAHGFLRPEQVTEQQVERARRLNELAQQRGQTLAQMAVAWVLRQPAVTSALVGASSVAQVEDNVAALGNLDFTVDELTTIDGIAGS